MNIFNFKRSYIGRYTTVFLILFLHLPQFSPIVARKLIFPLVDRQLLLDNTLLLDYSDISPHLFVAVQESYYDRIFISYL